MHAAIKIINIIVHQTKRTFKIPWLIVYAPERFDIITGQWCMAVRLEQTSRFYSNICCIWNDASKTRDERVSTDCKFENRRKHWTKTFEITTVCLLFYRWCVSLLYQCQIPKRISFTGSSMFIWMTCFK